MFTTRYRPYWERIIFLALLFHIIIVSAISASWKMPAVDLEDELQEIEWYEEPAESSEIAQEVSAPAEIFPEIDFPPIEIPKIPEPTLIEPEPQLVEAKTEVTAATESKPAETKAEGEKEKSDDDSTGKLKVISKVLPRDIVAELVSSGVIAGGRALKAGKVVLAVTIGTEGKITNVEIRRGGGNDENGNLINILSEAAAIRWIFEPFKDENGKAKEIKTQIEFKPEDF